MSLIGAPELRRRLTAIEHIGKPISQRWADAAVPRMRARIPVRTGQTRSSVRSSVTDNGAQLLGSPVVHFLSSGTKAHDETPLNASVLRFQVGGQAIFSKKVHKPATLGKHFEGPVAAQAASDVHMADELVKAWNGAA